MHGQQNIKKKKLPKIVYVLFVLMTKLTLSMGLHVHLKVCHFTQFRHFVLTGARSSLLRNGLESSA